MVRWLAITLIVDPVSLPRSAEVKDQMAAARDALTALAEPEAA